MNETLARLFASTVIHAYHNGYADRILRENQHKELLMKMSEHAAQLASFATRLEKIRVEVVTLLEKISDDPNVSDAVESQAERVESILSTVDDLNPDQPPVEPPVPPS